MTLHILFYIFILVEDCFSTFHMSKGPSQKVNSRLKAQFKAYSVLPIVDHIEVRYAICIFSQTQIQQERLKCQSSTGRLALSIIDKIGSIHGTQL